MGVAEIMYEIHRLDESEMDALCEAMAHDYCEQMKKAADKRIAEMTKTPSELCFEMSGHMAALSNYMLRVRRLIESQEARIKEAEGK